MSRAAPHSGRPFVRVPVTAARAGRGRGGPQGPPAAVTVLCANLWHDWPRGRRLAERLDAFAELVLAESVDLVLLQEVMRSSAVHADEWLSERLDMDYVYARAHGHRGLTGFEEGVAILSRFPLRAAAAAALGPRPGRFLRRLALAARIEVGGAGLVAVTTHLALRRRRNAFQLAALEAFVEEVAGGRTAVVGGDLNADETRPELRPLLRRWRDLYRLAHPEGDAATFEWRGPLGVPVLRRRLDYLLLRPGAAPWRCVAIRRTEAPGGGHSDHRALLARLEPGEEPRQREKAAPDG